MDREYQLHANGKLLISGEYLVLAGAKALAFPVRFGQSIHLQPNDKRIIDWRSEDTEGTWLTCEINPVNLKLIRTSDFRVSEYLETLLRATRDLNSSFLEDSPGLNITVTANYPLRWGLGSSSTLIALVAGWAHVDKFKLFRKISQGSGYDVASSDRNSLFFYQLSGGEGFIEDAQPGNAIIDHACFAYLGNKKESAGEVSAFLAHENYTLKDVHRISELSVQICKTNDPSILCSLVDEHEEILSSILIKERVAKRFEGFPGSVKSMGAWGGDFAMFVSSLDNSEIIDWLRRAGFHDIFTFNQLKTEL